MAKSFLYENMHLLDKLSIRLGSKTYSEGDIAYLAETLKSICDGVSPEEAFDIKQGSGENRADFRKHQRNIWAMKQIAAYTDVLEANLDDNGNLVVYEVDKKAVPKTWSVISKVAKKLGIEPGTLRQYWKDPRYKNHKTTEA